MLGLSAGNGTALVNASESPEALKNDCPCVAICWKITSPAAPGDAPPPHEQLSCFDRLSLAMRLRMSTHGLPFGASYT